MRIEATRRHIVNRFLNRTIKRVLFISKETSLAVKYLFPKQASCVYRCASYTHIERVKERNACTAICRRNPERGERWSNTQTSLQECTHFASTMILFSILLLWSPSWYSELFVPTIYTNTLTSTHWHTSTGLTTTVFVTLWIESAILGHIGRL